MKYALIFIVFLIATTAGASTDECKCEVTCFKNSVAHALATTTYNRHTQSAMFGQSCHQDADVTRKFSGYVFCQSPRTVALDNCNSNCSGSWLSRDRYSCGTVTCGNR